MNEKSTEMYYIEAIKGMSTRIGKVEIMPKQPPKPFTPGQYNAHLSTIEHYVEAGVIMVSKPGTSSSARAAREIKRETEMQEKIFASGKSPPAPMERKMGHMAEPAEDKVATFSEPSETANQIQRCHAVTATSQKRCKKDASRDMLVCKIHLRMLQRGKEIWNEDGKRIAEDGKDLD